MSDHATATAETTYTVRTDDRVFQTTNTDEAELYVFNGDHVTAETRGAHVPSASDRLEHEHEPYRGFNGGGA